MTFETIYQTALIWLTTHGLRILAIIITTYFLHKFAHVFIDRTIRKTITAGKYKWVEAKRKREDTLISIVHQAFQITLWGMAGLLILTEVGVNTSPLIAGAGIIGLAFGFGGQYLIKDLISGFFVILENQYRVGDVVCFDKTCGMVESVNLRTTVLRDLDGIVHHVPNGEVTIASNMSKYYSRVNLDIGISYNSDLEKVIKVVNKVGNELANDKEWSTDIIKPPQFLRVNSFADSAIMIKILGDTQPLAQWKVAGEYRKRLKIAFDKAKIEIPFPQRVIHQSK